jgi:hypothetical protein
MSDCTCTNCIRTRNYGGWSPCKNYKPCGEVFLSPINVNTPMPECNPPKKDTLSEYAVLKKMLKHFKEEHAKSNQSLQESGDSKYCTSFDAISVSELKDYMIKVLEEELGL